MILDTLAAIPTAHLVSFVAAGLALNVAPGQDVMFASACGLRGGPRAGALAGFGVGLGVLVPVTKALVDRAHETCPYSKAVRGNIEAAINLV